MPARYRVTATSLNFRSSPDSSGTANIILVLNEGQEVTVLDGNPPAGWWRVAVAVPAREIELVGFVSSRFLEALPPPPPPPAVIPRAVHMTEGRADIRRDKRTGRAYPLGEPNMPRRTANDVSGRTAQIGEIIRWLDVERSLRYSPDTSSTFCNIYAYDFCYLTGVYCPRVWWTSAAWQRIMAGETVTVKYDVTVRELNANSLHDWFTDHGPEFGWRRVFDLTEMQDAANQGKIGIIVARRKDLNRSGHIVAVVPETAGQKAVRTGNQVTGPLQSQAGARNRAYSTGVWWTHDRYATFGYWIHD